MCKRVLEVDPVAQTLSCKSRAGLPEMGPVGPFLRDIRFNMARQKNNGKKKRKKKQKRNNTIGAHYYVLVFAHQDHGD